MLSLLRQIWYIIGFIFIVTDVQILKKNLTIRSHCSSQATQLDLVLGKFSVANFHSILR